MDTPQDTELMRTYIQSISSSRVAINNMLNVFLQQDRNMQSIIVLTHQHRRQLVQRDARDSGIHFPSDMYNIPHFTQHLPNNRRERVSTRGSEWTRTFPNNNNRNRTSQANRSNTRQYVQRHPSTPFSSTGPSFDMPINLPINRHTNMPVPPQWLVGGMNHLDPLTPVIVRPTEDEINISTEEVIFGIMSNPVNAVCPITRERFGESDRVMQIVYCGHNFNPPSLRHWFHTNVKCPLCRYDIRDYDPRNAINNPYRTLPPRATIDERTPADILNPHQQSDSGDLEGGISVNPNSERTLQVNVANRANVVSSIASYISQDIMAQLDNIPIDGSGNILLEYSFRHPETQPPNPTMHDMSGNVQ
jgi:hypothetical protein